MKQKKEGNYQNLLLFHMSINPIDISFPLLDGAVVNRVYNSLKGGSLKVSLTVKKKRNTLTFSDVLDEVFYLKNGDRGINNSLKI